MSIAYYANTPAQGRRVATEQTAMIPPQIVGKSVDLLNPNVAPFALFVHKTQKKAPVGDFTYYYHDDEHPIVTTKLTAVVASGGTTWNVTTGHGTCITPNMILFNKNNGVRAQVISVSSDAITVLDNVDSGGAAAGSVGDEIEVLAPALAEGTNVMNMVSTEPNKWTNYIQNMQRPVIITKHGQNSDQYYGEKDEARQWKKAGIEFQQAMDRAMMFNGAPALLTFSTQTLPSPPSGGKGGLTMGFEYFMKTYADADHYRTETDLTEFEFLELMEAAFQAELGAGSDHKICLAPRQFTTGMLKWNLAKQRFWGAEKMAGAAGTVPGLRINRYETTDGIVDFIRYNPFETKLARNAGGWNYLAIIDTARIGYVPYKNMDTYIERDVVQNGAQIIVGYYFASIGTVWHQPNTHVMCKFQTVSVA